MGVIGTQINRQAPQTLQSTVVPSPSQGIDSRQPISAMRPDTCLYTYNMMPGEYGMQMRFGYREWNIGVDNGASLGVHSVIAFEGALTGAADDRLFAINNEGIWDVTTYDTAPVLKIAFADQSVDAGYGVKAHYVDQAGEEYLFFADARNGLFEYQASTDAWIQATGITGPDITKVAFIVVHKQRLWMIEQDSTIGWYLPVASKTGAATEFYFGSKFPHGGLLKGLFSWSVDGGAGVDDILVAIASSGDVVPYQGEDPSSADTWATVGSYFIGKTPRGRRIANEYGGNLYILSAYGIIAMSDLLRGVDPKDVSGTSLTFKIARQLREQLLRTSDEYGWDLQFMPSIGSLIVDSPQEVGYEQIQYVMSLTTSAWGLYRGLPMACMEDYQGKVYFGTLDSRVMVMDVYRDGVTITPPEPPLLNGSAIEFSILSAYQTMAGDTQHKQVQFIRPDFWAANEPTYEVKALYDFSVNEITFGGGQIVVGENTWDTALWDEAIWGGSRLGEGWHDLLGTGGLGRWVAIAMRGSASDFTRFMSWDVMWQAGGPV